MNINSLSLKMIEALDKLVSSTKDEDGKIQFASRDLHLSIRMPRITSRMF